MWEPFGTRPSNDTGGWRSGPNERGTLNIASTCILTLFLCAYTSLHLDIPKEGNGNWRDQFKNRAIWVFVGLVAPEFLAHVAFQQLIEARNLDFKMHDLTQNLASKPKDQPPNAVCNTDIELEERNVGFGESDRAQESVHGELSLVHHPMQHGPGLSRMQSSSLYCHPWTRIHSYFTLMGGFVIDLDREQRSTLGIDEKRLILTPIALRALAEKVPELLPNISTTSILDKSKANALAKFLVCTQAMWFLVQTIGRLATSLPISLLELNTGLHAICSLFIYIAWWDKPLDIEEPHIIRIQTEFAIKVCAWMLFKDHSNFKSWPNRSSLSPLNHLRLVYEDDITKASDDRSAKEEEEYSRFVAAKELNKIAGRPQVLLPTEFGSQLAPRQYPGEVDHIFFYVGQTIHGFTLLPDIGHKDPETTACSRVPITQLRSLQLVQSLRVDDHPSRIWRDDSSQAYGGIMLARGASLPDFGSLDPSLLDWRHKRVFSPNSVLLVCLLLAGSLYAGFHLIAWNGPFSSTTERNLWRASCLIIAGPPPLALAYFLGSILITRCSFLVRLVVRWAHGVIDVITRSVVLQHISRPGKLRAAINTVFHSEGLLVRGLLLIGIALYTILILAYPAARVYLIVECFINLAHLPDAAFQEPEWSQFIPHFGSG